jgi:hypothetical protein
LPWPAVKLVADVIRVGDDETFRTLRDAAGYGATRETPDPFVALDPVVAGGGCKLIRRSAGEEASESQGP